MMHQVFFGLVFFFVSITDLFCDAGKDGTNGEFKPNLNFIEYLI